MRRLEAQPLYAFNDTPVDTPAAFFVSLPNGQELDYDTMVANPPAVTTEYDGLTKKQTVIAAEDGLPLWDTDELYPVGRFASFHGRNLEVLAGQIAVVDQFGNEYQSLCIKGSDLSNPRFKESVTASRDYIIWGLQESLVMERVLRASRLLRESGIGTEYICGLALPESFPVGNSSLAIDDGETKNLDDLLERLASDFAKPPGDTEEQKIQVLKNVAGDKSPFELKADMIDRFKDCDYLISFRAMDSPFRFNQL